MAAPTPNAGEARAPRARWLPAALAMVAVAGCGGSGAGPARKQASEPAGTQASTPVRTQASAPGTQTTASSPATTPRSKRPSRPRRARPRGFTVSVYAGIEMFSERLGPGRYRLMMRRRGARQARRTILTGPTPFAVDLGRDRTGHVVAVVPRCTPSCSITAYDTVTRRRRTLPVSIAAGDRVRRASIDRGTVTFTVDRPGPATVIRQAADDGSPPLRTLLSVGGEIIALDSGRHGVAFVVAMPRRNVAHSRSTLYLRPSRGRASRRIAQGGFGEEGGDEIVSASVGSAITWAIAGSDDFDSYGAVQRLDLRTGRRGELRLTSGGVVSAAADPTDPGAPILVAHDPQPNSNGDGPDPRRQVLREIPSGQLR